VYVAVRADVGLPCKTQLAAHPLTRVCPRVDVSLPLSTLLNTSLSLAFPLIPLHILHLSLSP
jgi:hypothetical protein